MSSRTRDYDTLDFKFELKELTDAGEIDGYAAVFGNVDLGGDVIEPGAFTKTIEETGGKVPILWQHDRYEPIGISTSLEQDRKGLRVKGQLNMEVQRGREARSLLNQGAMQGLSVGYKAIKPSYENGIRHLKEMALKEFSPVVFPMNPLATATVKAAGDLVWDPETTFAALQSALRAALNPPGIYAYWIRDIAAAGDSALVSSYDDDAEAWVVPFSVDSDGNVTVSPSSDWTEAEQVWVESDDAGKSALAVMQARAFTTAIAQQKRSGGNLSPHDVSALKTTRDNAIALLALAEPATEATPADAGAAKQALEPALATLRDLTISRKERLT
jgi:HK97 family phage prohead protease